MRPLIVAPTDTPLGRKAEIRLGERPRLDYYELACKLNAPYLDYNSPLIEHHPIFRALEQNLRLDLYWAKKIAMKAREGKHDLIISLSERVGIPLSYLMDGRIKHVTLSHKPLSPHKLSLIKTLGTFRRWDKMFVFSEAEAEVLRSTFAGSPDRIRAIHWGVDVGFYKPPEQEPEQSEEPHIFSIGLSNRDYPTLIRAMRRLPHVQCHICAKSAWEIHDAGFGGETLPANVHLKSYDHPLAIREAYSRCRLVVIPMQRSTVQWSAGCTSVLQPQAMGRPVIATNLPGLAEYMVEGETGLLAEGGNPEAMARAIDQLWRDPAGTAAMGRRGREWVAGNRTLDQSIDKIVATVEGLA